MKLELRAEKGSKIRSAGLIPGVLYGKGIESTPIQTTMADFREEYQRSGITKTFKVKLKGKSHIVFFKEVQPELGNFHIKRHFDLVKVSADDTLTSQVYVKFLNKDEVKRRGLAIHAFVEKVEVEYPVGSGIDSLEVDVTGLEKGAEVKAKDIELPKDVSLVTDPESIVLQIHEQRIMTEEVEEEGPKDFPLEVEAIKQSND